MANRRFLSGAHYDDVITVIFQYIDVFALFFRDTPKLGPGMGNDGWTKVGGSGNNRPKIRYSLDQLRAIQKNAVCTTLT